MNMYIVYITAWIKKYIFSSLVHFYQMCLHTIKVCWIYCPISQFVSYSIYLCQLHRFYRQLVLVCVNNG